MVDEHVLNSALRYLDTCTANHEQASLVGMWEFVDYFLRAHLPAAVVNEALKLRPTLFVHRSGGRVFFNQLVGDREVTEEDIQKNWEFYHTEFWEKHRQENPNS